ncbi:phosphate ABC transporter substrate-binding protein [Nostoc spongiaeforme FACHB-130]|uniref:Phosphate ABC transporter substrate-binding protein n=1 Tax=Nostoc spongiaeforme FACHB-130 TaxID=1357510 RepID=A0ABR8G1Y0_9NOSO|nr:substrate-binding domain-containing protein [Nostoc spongiaeforme]MBD2597255.1 phosphate ABC transporter substrate-binding protein [Nostoc spongiaeforme FACHB-130]
MKIITTRILLGLVLFGLCSCNSVKSTSPTNNSPITSQNNPQTQLPIKLASSSSSVTLLKVLTEAYQANHKTATFEFVSQSQSEGAIAALKNGIVDIAGSSHKLKPEEDDGKIQYREIAQDLLVVATHNSVKSVTNLTTDQLKSIYAGKITNWKELGGPNAKIVVLDRPEDESAKKLLRKYYLGQDKTTTQAVILNKEGELIDTIQSTPYSIGAFSLAYSLINQLPVNHLNLNGNAPNKENFTSGKYQMVRHLGLIWQKTPTSNTQKFIDFVFSPEGTKLLQDKGFITKN